jgi:hypothetical protein
MNSIPSNDAIVSLNAAALVDLFNRMTRVRTPDAKPVVRFASRKVGLDRTMTLANALRASIAKAPIAGVPSAQAKNKLAAAKAPQAKVAKFSGRRGPAHAWEFSSLLGRLCLEG